MGHTTTRLTICSVMLLGLLMIAVGTPAIALAGDGIVSFNKASVEELMAIEDIDIPKFLAEAIVQYREAHGPFKTPDEMKNVPGMTAAFIEELNPQLDEDGDVVFDPDAEPALAPSKC